MCVLKYTGEKHTGEKYTGEKNIMCYEKKLSAF